jgi:hypothetical protein
MSKVLSELGLTPENEKFEPPSFVGVELARLGFGNSKKSFAARGSTRLPGPPGKPELEYVDKLLKGTNVCRVEKRPVVLTVESPEKGSQS